MTVNYWVEYRRPWKLATLAAGIAVMVVGSFFHPAPDWDVGISILMPVFTYLLAPWSVRVIVERRWKWWPAMLFATWFTVDGCYTAYWYFMDPVALEQMREANFLASLPLYGLCGLIWFYAGSLRELLQSVNKAVRRPEA